MLECTFVSFVASPIFLEKAARRDLVRIVDMKKFTEITFFTLILEPMHAYSPFPFALIYPLVLRFQDCIELISASYLNTSLCIGVSIGHGNIAICGRSRLLRDSKGLDCYSALRVVNYYASASIDIC
jgi:hypothetical protein